MQAILTKTLGLTNARSMRVLARAWAGTLTVQWDDGLDPEENHKAAARAFARKFNWNDDDYGALVTGCLVSGDYCHVFTQRGARQKLCAGEGPHELGEVRVYNVNLCRACYIDAIIHDPKRKSERIEPFEQLALYAYAPA